jgi:hypothetical protein
VPQAGDFLSANELLINWPDGKIYGKHPTTNAVISHTLGGGDDPRWSYLLPSAPTGVTATAGNAQATVSWTAPASVAPITDYVVQYSSNSGSTWTTASEGTSTATSATVTGLTNGTTYIFRVAAVSGIGQGGYSTVGSDPSFSSVSLLMHGDGTLADSSAYARTVTPINGAAATGTAKWGSASLSFNGTNQYMTTPYTSALDLATGDWTVEAWVYLLSLKDLNDLWQITAGGVDNRYTHCGVVADSAGALYFLAAIASDQWANVTTTANGTISANTWTHVAAVRSGNDFRLYVGGSLALSYTYSGSLFSMSGQTVIGANAGFADSSRRFHGYIDDFRVTKVARYSGSTITVPTAAFSDGPLVAATPTA